MKQYFMHSVRTEEESLGGGIRSKLKRPPGYTYLYSSAGLACHWFDSWWHVSCYVPNQ
jgi:hypothetical protein